METNTPHHEWVISPLRSMRHFLLKKRFHPNSEKQKQNGILYGHLSARHVSETPHIDDARRGQTPNKYTQKSNGFNSCSPSMIALQREGGS